MMVDQNQQVVIEIDAHERVVLERVSGKKIEDERDGDMADRLGCCVILDEADTR